MGTHIPQRQIPSTFTATHPSLLKFATRTFSIVLLLTFFSPINSTPPALADGKVFTVVTPDPIIPTIPAQRAIIGWNPPKQTLAIDTAFVAPGSDFAWLVPLPSQPDITPIAPGAFEAAAAITAPQIEGDLISFVTIGFAVYLTVVAVLLLWVQFNFKGWRLSALRALIALFIVLVGPLFFLPFLSHSRGSSEGTAAGMDTNPAVSVLSRSTAGVYDTAVITADDASELLDWLTHEGFHFESDIVPVVQSYLDQGWVFASAKVSSKAQIYSNNSNSTANNNATTASGNANNINNNTQQQNEHRPHPLLFSFETDRPVYPMALTAVGNTPIHLDLYILANGSATAANLTSQRSMTVSREGLTNANIRGYWVHSTRNTDNQPRLVHEDLNSISLGTANITHLAGELSPIQQSKDIYINVRPFVKNDTVRVLPSVVLSIVAACFFWLAAIVLIPINLLLITGDIGPDQARALIKRSALFIIVVTTSVGLAASNNIYTGPVTKQRPPSQTFAFFVQEAERIIYRVNQNLSPDETVEAFIERHFDWYRNWREYWPQLEQDHNRGAPMTYRVVTDPDTGVTTLHARSPAGQLFVFHPDHVEPLTYNDPRLNSR